MFGISWQLSFDSMVTKRMGLQICFWRILLALNGPHIVLLVSFEPVVDEGPPSPTDERLEASSGNLCTCVSQDGIVPTFSLADVIETSTKSSCSGTLDLSLVYWIVLDPRCPILIIF